MSFDEIYAQLIKTGQEAVQQITDPFSKAMACAALASAIDPHGSSPGMNADALVQPAKVGKKSRKTEKTAESAGEEAPVEQETAEQPVCQSETTPATTATAEWTEDMIELYSAEYHQVNGLIDEYGMDTVNEWVKHFSANVLTDVADITPQNIQAFIAFLTTPADESESA